MQLFYLTLFFEKILSSYQAILRIDSIQILKCCAFGIYLLHQERTFSDGDAFNNPLFLLVNTNSN